MSGALHLQTPWARKYFPEDARPEVEALIPDGTVLTVGALRAPGKPWVLRLQRADDRSVELWRTEVYMLDLRGACLFALRRKDAAA